MSEILDKVFPEPDGEWIGAEIYVKSNQRFKDFENLINYYNYTEKTAAKLAMSDVSHWPEDVRKNLRGY
jgi:hypothetical protein